MSLLNLNLQDVPDQIVMPEGEYQLMITKAEQMNSKAGNPMITVYFNIIDEPDAKMIAHYFTLPTGKDDKNANNKLRRLKEFYTALDFDLAGEIDTEDFKGKEVWAFLKESDDDEFGKGNNISRFVLNK